MYTVTLITFYYQDFLIEPIGGLVLGCSVDLIKFYKFFCKNVPKHWHQGKILRIDFFTKNILLSYYWMLAHPPEKLPEFSGLGKLRSGARILPCKKDSFDLQNSSQIAKTMKK